jgi:nicotinamidase-related amidase
MNYPLGIEKTLYIPETRSDEEVFKVNVTMKSALIIVDIQKDFMPGGALGIAELEIKNHTPNQSDHEAFSPLSWHQKNYHPKNHISFASSHPKRRPADAHYNCF